MKIKNPEDKLLCEFMNNLDSCNNEARAKISFDFARWDWDYKRKPYGNRMKKIPCCSEHLEFQKENQYIMNLEVVNHED